MPSQGLNGGWQEGAIQGCVFESGFMAPPIPSISFPTPSPRPARNKKDTWSTSYRQYLDITPSSCPQEYRENKGLQHALLHLSCNPSCIALPPEDLRSGSSPFPRNSPQHYRPRTTAPQKQYNKRPSRDGFNQTYRRMQRCPTLEGRAVYLHTRLSPSYSPSSFPVHPPSSCQLQDLLTEWESWKICVLTVLPAYQPPGSPEALHRIGRRTEPDAHQESNFNNKTPPNKHRPTMIHTIQRACPPPRSLILLASPQCNLKFPSCRRLCGPPGSPAEHEGSTRGKVPWLTGVQGPGITVLLAPMRRRPSPPFEIHDVGYVSRGTGGASHPPNPLSRFNIQTSVLPCLIPTTRRIQITSVPPPRQYLPKLWFIGNPPPSWLSPL
ncbi:hypothetical protein LY78DRAFT_199174 [Colletotrichum sublineola]|nr:hypothetical protein LY78DRAFT_199174 [Colletotrichum sublineola]